MNTSSQCALDQVMDRKARRPRLPRVTEAEYRQPAACLAVFGLALLLHLPTAGPASAQTCSDSTVPGTLIGFTPLAGDLTRPNSCDLLPCYEPEIADGPSVEVDPACDALAGPCPVRAKVALDFPGNSQMPTNTHVRVYWFDQATPPVDDCLPPPFGSCSPISICGPLGAEILVDKGETWIQPSVSCADIAAGRYQEQSFSVGAYACQTPFGNCTKRKDVPGIDLPPPQDLWELLKCDPPPPPCEECECNIGGGGFGGGGSAGGGPPGFGPPASGPGALLRYKGRGVGHPSYPGAAAWNLSLGRYWSHDYAQRIVVDPDAMGDEHVWLLGPKAGFQEFKELQDGTYLRSMPSDEYRTLTRTANGWELRDLDGRTNYFGAAGLWLRSEDRFGNAKVATYSGGVLAAVSFPDGRSEALTYHPDGKLATITEIGVGDVDSRLWSYTWSGLDLVRIDRPDGTSWRFLYEDTELPGLITRMSLFSSDSAERIVGAWEYDTRGNVVRTWKGDVSFNGPEAVEQYSFFYDNPFRPVITRVIDPLGVETTYTLDRDPGGVKPRFLQIEGECPSCGSGPNTQLAYDDPANPLRATRLTDADGTVTLSTFDVNGRRESQVEAAGTPFERTSTTTYNAVYPSLIEDVEQPSTSGSGVQRTSWSYDAAGNATAETEEGVENGSAFSYTTTTTYNASGRPLVIDPPGYGTQDRTVFVYDPSRGNLVPSSRTDLIGTMLFDHDGFNRRTRLTDPNGIVVEMTYDALDRLETAVHKGATAAEDAVTTQVYNSFGDLFRTIKPEGNIIEYGYDGIGRLTSVERKPDAATPGERTLLTLDASGKRIREDLQTWSGSGWQTESFSRFEYSNGCFLNKFLHADGSVTELAYDCEGRLERAWDANHPSNGQQNPASRSYTYDVLGRLSSVSVPWSGGGGGSAVTRYRYDDHDHLIEVIDANDTVTRYDYSDRGLLTRETSEISGTRMFAYNEHGWQIREQDARGIEILRFVDAVNRVTLIDYPEDSLDTTYIYDDPGLPFSKGRLSAIIRDGESVDYSYDRLGRLTRDGALLYGYDKNNNRRTIGYPNGVIAAYTYDFADRHATLSIDAGSGPPTVLVSGASYKPSGPLTSLDLGNGLNESRSYDSRYFPARIEVAGRLDWRYTTDSEGHITAISDQIEPAASRVFAYQDNHYFLTAASGPWGSLGWTYDRVGNRLTETRNGETISYVYRQNDAGKSTQQLAMSSRDGAESRWFHDSSGNLTHQQADLAKTQFDYSAESRLSQIRRDRVDGPPALTNLRYDGRGFLSRSTLTPYPGLPITPWQTAAVYSSDGVLHYRTGERAIRPDSLRGTPLTSSEETFFYFAGRPVAQLLETERTVPGEPPVSESLLTYLSTDHLGAPVLASTTAGELLWSGGFEPFGTGDGGARESGISLRLPGQWTDSTWDESTPDTGLFYNAHRWYFHETGKYSRPDPVNFGSVMSSKVSRDFALSDSEAESTEARLLDPRSESAYGYATQNPVTSFDRLGLVDPATLFGAAATCAVADGPLPIGDVIGIGLAVTATVIVLTRPKVEVDVCLTCPIAFAKNKDKWTCRAKCNIDSLGIQIEGPDVRGPSQFLACLAAKKAANAMVPGGAYKRHCRCICSKR